MLFITLVASVIVLISLLNTTVSYTTAISKAKTNLENGDYLRFKTVQIGYTLPNDAISKIGAQKLRLFITGENLLTLTDYTGFDPEIGGNVMGIDKGYYPQARSFMFGLNLQF